MKKALILFMLVGCSSTDPQKRFVVSAPASDQSLFWSAAGQWNACAFIAIDVTDGPGDVSAVPVDHLDAADDIGSYSSSERTIRYVDRTNASVVAHEMGHMAGIRFHTASGLMSAFNTDGRVTQADCDLLRATLD